MVLAEFVKFKHGLYKSCGVCFEGIMLEPCLLQPCLHVAGQPTWTYDYSVVPQINSITMIIVIYHMIMILIIIICYVLITIITYLCFCATRRERHVGHLTGKPGHPNQGPMS